MPSSALERACLLVLAQACALAPGLACAPRAPAAVGPEPASAPAASAPAASAQAADDGDDTLHPGLVKRSSFGLRVDWPPARRTYSEGRASIQVEQVTPQLASQGTERVWVGAPVPNFVPIERDGLELSHLSRAGKQYLAGYRQVRVDGTCHQDRFERFHGKCRASAVLFERGGEVWSLELTGLYLRDDTTGVGDMQLADGVLYFSDYCNADEANVKLGCWSLHAVDPLAQRTLWVSSPDLSRDTFFVVDKYVLVHGFEGLSLLRRGNGSVAASLRRISGEVFSSRISREQFVLADPESHSSIVVGTEGTLLEEPRLFIESVSTNHAYDIGHPILNDPPERSRPPRR